MQYFLLKRPSETLLVKLTNHLDFNLHEAGKLHTIGLQEFFLNKFYIANK